jgi:tight adherence protein B
MSPLVISIAAFFAVTAAVFAVIVLLSDRKSNKVEDRLSALARNRGSADPAALREEIVREGLSGLGAGVNGFLSKFTSLENLFEQAACPLTPQNFFMACGGSAVAGLVASALARAPGPLYPVVMLVFAGLPFVWLWWRRKCRFDKFAKQMPDALELVGRALRSGHSLASGLRVVVDEMPAPIADEFGRVYESQNLGIPLEQALKDMLKRMPNMDLKFFVTAVVLQRQTGGDMAEILDKIGHIIRERFRILGQVQALTGEGRISGVVLMGLPIALFFACYYLNQDYVMLLFTDPLGKKMIAGAIFLQILGAVTIKKIITIKV